VRPWLKVAGPSKRQLSAELGESECDRFLEATRAVIIEVVRESGDAWWEIKISD
jgi:hypothetical protein